MGGKGKEEVRSHLATFFSLKWKDLEGKNGAVSNALFNVNNFIFFKKVWLYTFNKTLCSLSSSGACRRVLLGFCSSSLSLSGTCFGILGLHHVGVILGCSRLLLEFCGGLLFFFQIFLEP